MKTTSSPKTELGGYQKEPRGPGARHTFSKTNNDELIKFCKETGLRRAELGELRRKDLVTREQIEAKISQMESRSPTELMTADAKRLEILQDTLLFEGRLFFAYVRNGKGKRECMSPIIGPDMEQIIERIKSTPPEEEVWQHIHQSADIYGYWAEYVTIIYRAEARAIKEISYDWVTRGVGRKYHSEVYTCRRTRPAGSWTRWQCWSTVKPWATTDWKL